MLCASEKTRKAVDRHRSLDTARESRSSRDEINRSFDRNSCSLILDVDFRPGARIAGDLTVAGEVCRIGLFGVASATSPSPPCPAPAG
ncbi:hypothetical protein DXU03_18920 [Rhizobium johnstonii]